MLNLFYFLFSSKILIFYRINTISDFSLFVQIRNGWARGLGPGLFNKKKKEKSILFFHKKKRVKIIKENKIKTQRNKKKKRGLLLLLLVFLFFFNLNQTTTTTTTLNKENCGIYCGIVDFFFERIFLFFVFC